MTALAQKVLEMKDALKAKLLHVDGDEDGGSDDDVRDDDNQD